MILRLTIALLAMVAGLRSARADHSYLDGSAALEWQVARQPRPSVAVAAPALAAIATLRGTPAVAAPLVPVWSAWASGKGLLAAADEKGVVTALPLAADERIVALRARLRFVAGAEAPRVAVLELKVRYRSALIVSLNGKELARRHVGTGPTAERVHGREWESIYLEVPRGLLVAGANLLELEVRPHRQHAVPMLEVTLAGRERASVVRGPIVQRVEATRAVIVVETDVPAPVTVSAAGRTWSSPAAIRHLVQLEALPPGGAVRYVVSVPGQTLPEHVLHTLPEPAEPLRLAVYGDVRSGHEVHARLAAAMLAWDPDAVLTSGDMVLRGGDEADWQRYFEVTAQLLASVPVYPAIGNHDVAASGLRHLDDIFALPPAPPGRAAEAAYWSTDLAGVHLVALDSNRYDDAQQLTWLERDLADARARHVRAIIAICHDGPWSRGLHGGNAQAREKFVPLLEKHRVELLISGHDHLYQRGKVGHLTYVVSGGGGAPLYKPRCGTASTPACKVKDGMQAIVSEHHWLALTVEDRAIELCPRRADGTLLEKCVRVPLADPR